MDVIGSQWAYDCKHEIMNVNADFRIMLIPRKFIHVGYYNDAYSTHM